MNNSDPKIVGAFRALLWSTFMDRPGTSATAQTPTLKVVTFSSWLQEPKDVLMGPNLSILAILAQRPKVRGLGNIPAGATPRSNQHETERHTTTFYWSFFTSADSQLCPEFCCLS